MAIVIPSKHIYSKSFDPVVDNNIDRVEANSIKPSTIYDYNTIVYNADFTDLGLYLPDNYDLKADNKSAHQTPATQPEMYYYAEAISFVNIRPAYTTVSIKIPKNQNNKLINKIYDKENIKYSLVLDEKTTVPISVTVNISSNDGKPTNSNISYAGFNWNYDDRQTAQIAGIELKDYLSVSNPVTVPEANATLVQGVTATASKTLSNQENISSIYATLNAQDDTWDLLNLKILTAVYVERAEENKYIKSSDGYLLSKTRTLSGTAEIYQAKKLSITIYGDTINLDLQDETKIIGDGNKVFSFDGNELIQTTNTPSIESKYQGIVDKWKNGKQTAVISCPIADYYSTLNKSECYVTVQLMSVSIIAGKPNLYTFNANNLNIGKVNAGDTLKGDGYYVAVLSVDVKYNSFYANVTKTTAEPPKYTNITLFNETLYTPINISSGRMLFQEGDIVIPYTYTNKGDKPLSYNKDFTPKQFKVVGTKISKRQGGMQELTLQEV